MRIELFTNQPSIKPNIFTGHEKENKNTIETGNIVSVAQQNNGKKQEKTGMAVTIAAFTTVIGLFMLSKGVQKSTNRYLNKFKDYLEKKSARSSIKDSKKKVKLYEFTIRSINYFLKKSESINNITSLKDILFMKLMYKTEPTKKLHESISKYFEKISEKTVQKSYEKTEKAFAEMNKLFDELDEYIIKNSADDIVEYDGKEYTKRELVEKAHNVREMSNMMVTAFIDKTTIKNRYDYINKATSSLYSSFWDASFKDFWSKNNKFKRKEMWQTFIAAEQIRFNKTKVAEYSSAARNAVSYTNIDQVNNVNEYLKELDNIIPPKDTEGIKIINQLKWFVKHPDIFMNNKDMFLKDLYKLKEHRLPLKTNSLAQAIENYKQENIDFIEKQIKDNRAGMLQEVLSYYYKIAPLELEKSGALLSLKKAVKSFDKSVNIEGVEFFDKVRDLRLGSAPTDVMTVVISFLTLSFGLGHAQDKDKRVSIMLKSGIPIIGGIATSMFSAARLVSGGKSLALGFLSGIVLNQLGIIADNMRNKIKTKNSNLIEV